jgi:hypothetical protein
MLTRLRLFVGGGAIFMQPNSELLFRQLRNQPADLTLLSAYLDALLEEGSDREESVRELLEATTAYATEPVTRFDQVVERSGRLFILQKKLGLR